MEKRFLRASGGLENFRFHRYGRVVEVGYDEIEKKPVQKLEQEQEVIRGVWQEHDEISRKKKMEVEDKAAQAHLVVAALITTVTFAAGITMPGGFIGGDDHRHPGSAVLRKSAAFQVFIITNALSLMLSSSSIFIHLFIPIFPSEDVLERRSSFLQIAFLFLLSSMAPMVLAFVTGLIANLVT
ncbi:protein ACCELERATED CELL DEATH 6-like [Carya illinoinensis]|uniref:protein ACCELERATED CELL DEATH 6-like n=1 Tax=Carya illinoinensis TaxID=32201 RepID=UPI001C727939|nr:protein ACCELERATED CELL DEATH 6-like [Carya illinoinensis]